MKFRALLVAGCVFAVGAMGSGVAGAAPKASTEYFTIVQTSFDGPQTVYAVGPISATGTDMVMGRHTDMFMFDKGSVTIKHYAKSSKNTYDPTTCVGTFTEKGIYDVVNGSGAYAGASGSGRYAVSGFFQGCDHHQPPTVALVIIQASGPLSL